MSKRLSPAEELKQERKRLKEECQIHKERIINTTGYVKDNLGSVLLNTVVGSSRSGLDTLFGSSPKTKSLSDNPIIAALPAIWNIAQPFIIGFATKKITARLFRKKRK